MPLIVNKLERIIAYTGGTSGNPYTGYTPHATDVFAFDDMAGRLATTENQAQILQQQGVAGQTVKLTGERAARTTLVATRYLALLTDWPTLLRQLQGLKGDTFGVAVTQNSQSVWPFDVESVQLAGDPTYIGVGKSSVQSNPTAKASFVITGFFRPAPLVP